MSATMPQLKWEPVDVLECFAVEPIVEDYEVSHTYEVHRTGLFLRFVVKQHDTSIQASLFREGSPTPIFSYMAYGRGEVRYINDKRGTYLRFEDSIIAPDHLWWMETRDLWNPEEHRLFSTTIRVAVDPDIRIEFEQSDSRT